jgi:mannose-6-phosphate isomerase-like protein (cupin superfamily)
MWEVIDVANAETLADGRFRKVRRALGATAFGINQVDLGPGEAGREHDESDTGHEEVYVVLSGSGTMVIDGEEVELHAGRYLLVSADARRKPVAGGDGLSFVAVGARPGDWEGRASL